MRQEQASPTAARQALANNSRQALANNSRQALANNSRQALANNSRQGSLAPKEASAAESRKVVMHASFHSHGGLLIDEKASGIGVLGLVPLLLAVTTIPLLRQGLLFEASRVEPLSLAIGVFAGHHFAEGRPPAVAILVFGGLVAEIFLPAGESLLAGVHLVFLAPQQFLLGPVFVLVFQLSQQLVAVVADLVGQLLSDFLLFLAVPPQLLLLFVYGLHFGLHGRRQLRDFLLLEFPDLC